ncbi:hypothetical protein [Ewingella americana]|uniref:Uncharacterized protein n=1 Tax=Ewingella americana TaxID=41202 RepID=A0A502GGK8_9GAMM|nr:hypothetical protein [Ewingella americana]TPG60096.1 hypothetical protein EAH77_16135 [Ewingella americana]
MGTVTLKIREDAGIDIGTLSELILNIAPNASVNDGTIVVDEAEESDVRAILAEVGIEVLDTNAVNASVHGKPCTQPELLEAAATNLATLGFSLHLTATADGATWNLIDAHANPVAAIHLADQEDKDSLASVFATEVYGNQLQAAVEKMGPKEVLVRTKARLYASSQVKAPEQVNIQAHVQNESLRASHCLDLALKAAHKNLIHDPLKQTVMAHLIAQKVANPSEVVTAMFEDFPTFMQTIRAQQDKYMGMDASALRATEDMLNDMEARDLNPSALSPANDAPLTAAAQQQRARLASGNNIQQKVSASAILPITPEAPAPQNELRASAAAAFSRY